MIKKIFTIMLLFLGILNSVNAESITNTFNIVNNKATLEVTDKTILVWTAEKNTSILDLFKTLVIDGKTITDNLTDVLDVRYINPDKVDFKVNTDTDIIDKNSTVYVSFKNKINNWMIQDNSTVFFELKNLKLKEIGNISDLKDNSYNKIYDVKYVTKDESIKVESKPETKVVENNILTDNNTWIKDNIFIILALIVTLFWLLLFPTKNKVNRY